MDKNKLKTFCKKKTPLYINYVETFERGFILVAQQL